MIYFVVDIMLIIWFHVDAGGQIQNLGRRYHRDETKTTMRRGIEKCFTETGESLVSCNQG